MQTGQLASPTLLELAECIATAESLPLENQLDSVLDATTTPCSLANMSPCSRNNPTYWASEIVSVWLCAARKEAATHLEV